MAGTERLTDEKADRFVREAEAENTRWAEDRDARRRDHRTRGGRAFAALLGASRLSADDQAAINRARDRAQAGRHESVEQERAAAARLREGTAQDRARRGRTGRGA